MGWRYFLKLCHRAENEALLSTLLEALLTPEEKANIALRCLIFQELLLQQRTQRQIAARLNVSIAKITRGSNALKRISLKLKCYLEKILLQ